MMDDPGAAESPGPPCRSRVECAIMIVLPGRDGQPPGRIDTGKDGAVERDTMTSNGKTSRREFLAASLRGGAAMATGSVLGARVTQGSAAAGEEPKGTGTGRLRGHSFRLGLDTYTLHRSLTAEDPRNRKDLWWVLDHLDELGLKGLQIDPSHFPGDDDKILRKLESTVKPRGYYLEFGMGGWDVRRLEARIRLTARFGGRAVRTFCGSEKNSQAELKNFILWATPAFREAGKIAEDHGVDIAVENHGDFRSGQLKELLDRVGHPRVGACLDTGNSLFRKEDPIGCARALAPYTRSMHLKDWVTSWLPDGTMQWKEAVPGKGQVPLVEILRMVLRHRRDLYIALEVPVHPSNDETETVAREWRHLVASVAATRQILAGL